VPGGSLLITDGGSAAVRGLVLVESLQFPNVLLCSLLEEHILQCTSISTWRRQLLQKLRECERYVVQRTNEKVCLPRACSSRSGVVAERILNAQ
jgi:hypothetical protein